MQNWVGDNPCNRVQRDVIDAEAPDKLVDVPDMLLVRFGSEKNFE